MTQAGYASHRGHLATTAMQQVLVLLVPLLVPLLLPA
jgi:hypothetical protein